jgi:hypothetical protein
MLSLLLLLAVLVLIPTGLWLGVRFARRLDRGVVRGRARRSGLTEEQYLERDHGVEMNWPALFSFRVWASSATFAFLVVFLIALALSLVNIDVSNSTLFVGVVFFPIFLFLLVAQLLDKSHILYCPFCRKRVKMGADVCHHCGRVVRNA